ncbi:MAG: thioredoxin domain-containing protein [Caldilineaceae bacterium]
MFQGLLKRLGLTPKITPPPSSALATTVASPIIDVTDSTFAKVVLAADKLVIVDFWAEWCQPCQIMSAYVTFLAKDFGDQIKLAAMDVDENPLTSPQYDIMGLPTLLFFYGGEVMDRVVGIEPYAEIQRRVAAWLAKDGINKAAN